MSNFRKIVFRGRKKEDGQWVEGNYVHNLRKGEFHAIQEQSSNNTYEIYRESLQLKDHNGEFENI